MVRFVGLGLALIVAARASTARADPSTPLVSPNHQRQEDTLRLRDHQRDLDDRSPVPDLASPSRRAAPPTARGASTHDGAGGLLLATAGIALLATGTFLALDAGSSDGSFGGAAALSGVTAVVTGIAGIAVRASSRSVQVAPTVSSSTVGLAIIGGL